jgi:hypothetical protein
MDKLLRKLNVDIEYDILLKNKLPLLIENKEWIEIFGSTKNKEILKDRESLQKLVLSEKEMEKRLDDIKTKKKRTMAKIITLSDEINNNNKVENISMLEQSQKELNEMNEEIEEIMFELEMMPRSIREANLKLLESTVKHAYLELVEREEELGKINSELSELREKLREYIVRKCDSEERINKIYSFLHNSLGNEKLNELDRNILK